MPLPLLVDLIPGEAPFSFLSRLAMRNGVNSRDLARDLDFRVSEIVDGDPQALGILADFGGVSVEELKSASYRKLAVRDYVRNGLPIPRHAVKSPSVRGCVECLRGDVQRSGQHSQIGMAIRANWQVPFLRTCPVHDLPFVTLWTDRKISTRHEPVIWLGLQYDKIMNGDLDPPTRKHSDFEDWIVGRLDGMDGHHWFDQHDFFAAATFMELLGRAVMLGWHQKSAPMNEDRWHEAGMIGFDVSQRGETFVKGMLTEIQKRGGSPQDGPNARFGPLHDRFSRDMTGPEFEPFRQILRQHILETWPLGPGDQVLGMTVTTRRMHSVRTASNETGIGTARLRKALAAAGLVPAIGERTSDAWDVFDAEAAAPVIASLVRSMGPSEVHDHFNFPRDQFDVIEAAGYLAPIATGEGTWPAYDPREIQRFLDALLERAVPMRQAPQGCCDIPTAARKLNCSAQDIVQLLHNGRLGRVGRHAKRPGYLGIIVDLKELRPLIQREDVIGYTLAHVGEEVGLLLEHVRRLVDAGLLKATLGKNPIKKVPQLYVTDTDFSEFNSSYVGLKNISLSLGQTRAATTKALIAARVFPLGGALRPYGPVYRRDIVIKRFLAPWPQIDNWPGNVAFL